MRIGRRGEAGRSRAARAEAHLVVIAGASVGRAFSLVEGATVGRSDCTIHVDGDDVSRVHAEFRELEGGWSVRDLGSMNGTFVNGVAVTKPHVLLEGDKIEIGTTVFRFALFDELDERYQARMYESALRDPLTRAFNRKYLEERLDAEFAYALRHDVPLTLLILDVDHFKQVNDAHGHLTGDGVLVELVERVFQTIRAEDVFARYGGEEFAVLARGITREGARVLAERLRVAIEGSSFRAVGPLEEGGEGDALVSRPISVTISVGGATMPDPEIGQPVALLARADDALYRAKHDGRNCVRIHGLPLDASER